MNELLASSAGNTGDFIELQNLSSFPADIGGWFLSDDPRSPKKYRIPSGTTIAPGGFWVATDESFGSNHPQAGDTPFGLSALGDEAYLFSAEANGNLTGYSHGFAFKS